MAEVNDGVLTQIQQLAAGFTGLYNDPKLGMKFKHLLKEWRPDIQIPEIDAAEPHVKTLQELRGELDKLKSSLAEKETDSKLDSALAAARGKYGLTDEGLEAVKKLMVDQRIDDPMIAAELLDGRARRERKVSAPLGRPQRIGADMARDAEKEKALYADPHAWAQQELLDGLRDIERRATEEAA